MNIPTMAGNRDLQHSAEKVNQETGHRFMFIVETMKVDGSDARKVDVYIVALNTAQAWRIMGEALQRFIESPRGRYVNAVYLTK